MVGSKVEHAGIIRHGAKMLYAISRATVPKVTVVVRKAYGAGYYVMNGKAYEPDLIVAWPSAEISVMGAEGAVNIIGRSAIEASDDPEATREAMLGRGPEGRSTPTSPPGNALIDDVIDPRETRPTIIRGLRMAADKRVERPWRKHGGLMPRHRRARPCRSSREAMSRFEDPVIICCSIIGAIANRDQCPAIPYTPEEYAAEARRASTRAASQIHIHARTPDGVPSYEIEDFRAITEAILAEVGDVIVNYSTGAIGVPIDKRIAYLRELQARRRGAEHELDELRQVLAAAQGLRLQGGVRELLRHDHRVPHGDERARDQARARVLRRRPRRQPRPAARHGAAAPSRCRSRW